MLLCDMYRTRPGVWAASVMALMQDFAADLRKLFAEADALDMGPLMQPGVDPQAAAASMASDAGVNNLLLQVWFIADTTCACIFCGAWVTFCYPFKPVWLDILSILF